MPARPRIGPVPPGRDSDSRRAERLDRAVGMGIEGGGAGIVVVAEVVVVVDEEVAMLGAVVWLAAGEGGTPEEWEFCSVDIVEEKRYNLTLSWSVL